MFNYYGIFNGRNMRQKNYKQKRTDLKNEKRLGMKNHFESNDQRRNFVQSIKRSYRSLKRSERQAIKKEINDKVWGLDEEQFDPDENKMTD